MPPTPPGTTIGGLTVLPGGSVPRKIGADQPGDPPIGIGGPTRSPAQGATLVGLGDGAAHAPV